MKEATQRWLEYERALSPSLGDSPEDEAYRINLREGAVETPEQPESLAILRHLRRFHIPMWSGAYADQPHYLMLELNTIIEVEIEMESIWHTNELLALQKTAT